MIGIYKITNPKGEIYIGQSMNLNKRRKHYLKLNCKTQPLIYNSIIFYGFENHTFEIIEECISDLLNERERFYQDFYNVLEKGLNCRLTSYKNKSGYLSNETKLKISKSKKGIKFSEKHKNVMSKNAYRNNIVLNMQTGIFYDSAKKACKTINENYYTFIARLNGRRKNDTGFLIV